VAPRIQQTTPAVGWYAMLARRAEAVVGVALAAALLAGVLLDALAWAVARYGPQGEGWSFRGNGALVVPVGLGPAALAGAWAALVSHSRGTTRWLPLGIGAGLVGAALVAVGVAALVLFGAAGAGVAARMTFLILA
jgi:hypothetical protein